MILPDSVAALFHHLEHTVDMAIIEGVMGLFDGQNYLDENGNLATCFLSAAFGWN